MLSVPGRARSKSCPHDARDARPHQMAFCVMAQFIGSCWIEIRIVVQSVSLSVYVLLTCLHVNSRYLVFQHIIN